jgi:hypothetical protein
MQGRLYVHGGLNGRILHTNLYTVTRFRETVEGTEIPSWVAAAGRTLFERSAELAIQGITLFILALERRRILMAAT